MNILESKEKLRKYCENVYYFNDDKKWCFFYDENENDIYDMLSDDIECLSSN